MILHNFNKFNNYLSSIKLLGVLVLAFLSFSCNEKATQQTLTVKNEDKVAENAININTASVEELEKLPRIGPKTAQKIVEYRDKYGKFRQPGHLLLVPGISDGRFRQIRHLVKVE